MVTFFLYYPHQKHSISLNQLIKVKSDLFLLGVIKIYSSFPDNLFLITDYKLFRRDLSKNEGGFIFPCKTNAYSTWAIRNTFEICSKLTIETPERRQSFMFLPATDSILPLEIHLGKQKTLIIGVWKPPSNNSEIFLNERNNVFSTCSATLWEHCL